MATPAFIKSEVKKMFKEIIDDFDQKRTENKIENEKQRIAYKSEIEKYNDELTKCFEEVIIPVMDSAKVVLINKNYPCKIEQSFAINEDTEKKWYSYVSMLVDLSEKYNNQADAIQESELLQDDNFIQFLQQKDALKILVNTTVNGEKINPYFCTMLIRDINKKTVEEKIAAFLKKLTSSSKNLF